MLKLVPRNLVNPRLSKGLFTTANSPSTVSLKKLLRHPSELVYNVISDVEAYPEFVPYCTGCRISARDIKTDTPTKAILMIGWNGVSEEFESNLTFEKDRLVVAEALDIELFKELYTSWKILPIKGHHDRCYVDYTIRYEFRSSLYNTITATFGKQLASTMVNAFESRIAAKSSNKL